MSGQERYSPLSENPHCDADSLRRNDPRQKWIGGGGGGAEEGGGQEEEEGREEEDQVEEEDSHGSRFSDDPSKLPKVVYVHRPSIHTYFRCPICLGILKKTRAVMGCLHRFCKECIDKSMRLGNKECPACRSHCASRRSLRNDTRFDAMIEMLYGNIEEYEKEELAIQEEEENHNKQVQMSIAQIFERQFGRRRKMDKDTPSSSARISPHNRRNYRKNTRGTVPEGFENNEENNDNGNKDSSSTDEQGAAIRQRNYKGKEVAQLFQPAARISLNNQKISGRKRKNSLRIEPEGSQNDEDEYNNNGNKETSLTDEQGRAIKRRKYNKRTRKPGPEGSEYNEDEYDHDADKASSSIDEQGGRAIKLRKYKRRTEAQPFQPCQSAAAANSDGVGFGNDLVVGGEHQGTSPVRLLNPEMLVWGRGGARSKNVKNVKNTRIMKLTKHLEKENDGGDELSVHIKLVSVDEQKMSNLKEPYLCCSPHCSVQHIKEYVTGGTQLPAEYFELLLVKKQPSSTSDMQSPVEPSNSVGNKIVLVLEGHESLVGLRDNYPSDINHMLMAYRLKERD